MANDRYTDSQELKLHKDARGQSSHPTRMFMCFTHRPPIRIFEHLDFISSKETKLITAHFTSFKDQSKKRL